MFSHKIWAFYGLWAGSVFYLGYLVWTGLDFLQKEFNDINFQHVLQVNHDWKKNQVSDIEVIDGYNPNGCESLYSKYSKQSFEVDDLVTFNWYGIRELYFYGEYQFED